MNKNQSRKNDNESRKVEKMSRNNYALSVKTLSILRWLAMDIPIKKIAERFNISIKTIYKHRSNLIKKELINKYNELTEKGRKIIYYGCGEESFRLHNVNVSIDVPKMYRKKLEKKRYNILALKKINYEKKYLRSVDYPYFSIDRATARVFPNVIRIKMPEIWGNSAEDATSILLELIFEYISKIEWLYKIELIQENKMSIAITSNEYAHIRNIMAEKYKKEGNVFYFRDKDKNLRLIIDYSHGVSELESEHKNHAESDITKAHKQINDWLEHDPPTNSELAMRLGEAMEIVSRSEVNMLHLDKNLMTHFKVLERIGDALDKFSKK